MAPEYGSRTFTVPLKLVTFRHDHGDDPRVYLLHLCTEARSDEDRLYHSGIFRPSECLRTAVMDDFGTLVPAQAH